MIRVSNSDGIKMISLERPEKANSINRTLLRELHAILRSELQPESKCLIITGSGEKMFSAGADLDERLHMSREEILEFLDLFRNTLAMIESIEIPTIAVLNGSAFGGGLELALACDIRIARDGIQLGLTETKLGIIPGAGGTQRLSRLIGVSMAMDLIFRGARLSAQEACKLGIVNHFFPKESFLHESHGYIRDVISSAPLALRYAKKAILRGVGMNLNDSLDIEREEYLKTLGSKDRIEALNAFKEKRPPVFRGE